MCGLFLQDPAAAVDLLVGFASGNCGAPLVDAAAAVVALAGTHMVGASACVLDSGF
jgi:hypothetical protein